MAEGKENLETKARKAVIRIEKKVNDIDNILRDLSMKLCYIIRKKGNYYTLPAGIDYDFDGESCGQKSRVKRDKQFQYKLFIFPIISEIMPCYYCGCRDESEIVMESIYINGRVLHFLICLRCFWIAKFHKEMLKARENEQ